MPPREHPAEGRRDWRVRERRPAEDQSQPEWEHRSRQLADRPLVDRQAEDRSRHVERREAGVRPSKVGRRPASFPLTEDAGLPQADLLEAALQQGLAWQGRERALLVLLVRLQPSSRLAHSSSASCP